MKKYFPYLKKNTFRCKNSSFQYAEKLILQWKDIPSHNPGKPMP